MHNTYHPPSFSRSSNLIIRLLSFWYYLAAPPEPPAHSPLLMREIARRGRVTSLVMLVTIAMVLLAFIIQPSVPVSITLIAVTSIDIIALLFNRKGKITIAGTIITSTTEIGLLLSLFGQLQMFKGVDFGVITFLPLLVQGIVVAVSTLPPLNVLLILVLNCSVSFVVIKFVPYARPFADYLHRYEPQTPLGIFNIPLTLSLIVGLVSLIWVLSANDAIRRADMADAHAEYEQEMALREKEVSDKLNRDLQEIAQVIALIASDPSREVQISRSNSLWVLATSLNNLRGRLLNVRFERSQYRELQSAAATLTSWLDITLKAGHCPPWSRTKTMMDEIAIRIQTLPLQARPDKEPWETTSTALDMDAEQQRLSQGIRQLHLALRSSQTAFWQPTGTVLDEVAAHLLTQPTPRTGRSQSQPLPRFTSPDHMNSPAPHTDMEQQRLKQGIQRLYIALRSPQSTSWQPTGTVLDEVAARLLLPPTPRSGRSQSQPLPNLTPPRHNTSI